MTQLVACSGYRVLVVYCYVSTCSATGEGVLIFCHTGSLNCTLLNKRNTCLAFYGCGCVPMLVVHSTRCYVLHSDRADAMHVCNSHTLFTSWVAIALLSICDSPGAGSIVSG